MSVTEFGTNSVHTVKRWSTSLLIEAIGQTYCKRFMGRGMNSPIRILPDLEKQAGDTIYYDLLEQTRAKGVVGDARLKNYEQPLVFYQDTLKIDQYRQAHSFRGMSQQRTVHNLRTSARTSLSQWWARTYDLMMFAYLAGTAGDDPHENILDLLGTTGFAGNPLQTPDAAHLYAVSDVFKIEQLHVLKEKAKVVNPKIRPVMVDGEPKYIYCCHPYTVTAMKTQLGATAWTEVQSRASRRGNRNPIYTGSIGEWNGIVIHESEYIARTTSGANELTHNIFMGQSAGSMGFGNAYKKSKRAKVGGGSMFSWYEEEDDFGNEEAIAAGSTFGIKKCRFNDADYGTIRHDTRDQAS